jgi:hypothetical protein
VSPQNFPKNHHAFLDPPVLAKSCKRKDCLLNPSLKEIRLIVCLLFFSFFMFEPYFILARDDAGRGIVNCSESRIKSDDQYRKMLE